MGWMGIWWFLGVALIAAFIWALLSRRSPAAPSDSPEEILRRRYAKGEIDKSTYERMLKDLRQ